MRGAVTFYSKPTTLDSIYGNNPVSWRLFVRLRPAKMKMDKQAMHDMHKRNETIPLLRREY